MLGARALGPLLAAPLAVRLVVDPRVPVSRGAMLALVDALVVLASGFTTSAASLLTWRVAHGMASAAR